MPIETAVNLTICPGCMAVLPASRPACPLCGLDLGWIAECAHLRQALASTRPHRGVELCVLARGPGGETTLSVREGQEARFTIPGRDGEWRLELAADRRQALLKHDAGRTCHLLLPAVNNKQWQGAEISVWLQASPDITRSCPTIEEFREHEIHVFDRIAIGSGIAPYPDFYSVSTPAVALRHAMVFCQRGKDSRRYWIADLGTSTGTFVNRQPIVARQLVAGDLVQIGPFAWTFNEVDGYLVPVRAIRGVALKMRAVSVRDRLSAIANLDVREGELVAIVGPSGAGKSTLLRSILSPAFRDGGQVLLNNVDSQEQSAEFRSLMGYVSQSGDTLHGDLRVQQCVALAARLRGRSLSPEEVSLLLRRLDLPSRRQRALLSELSGGERKRVQVAAALAARPAILLMDEPASGLDPQREHQLMRLLRGLSYQGCTILLITHSHAQLDLVDRVVSLEHGRITSSDAAADRCEARATREIEPCAPSVATTAPIKPDRPPGHHGGRSMPTTLRAARETSAFFARETQRIANQPLLRLGVALGLLPGVFAAALHLSIPDAASSRPLLGFLTILAAVFMATSLGLTSIVDEAQVIDYERLLFLRWPSYILAKWGVLQFVGGAQTLVFVGWLSLFRQTMAPQGALLHPVSGVLPCLLLVSAAAVGMGLLISAIAKWTSTQETAGMLLPLVMLAQIVFSVQVAGRGDASLAEAYGEFHWARCQGRQGCHQPVAKWELDHGGSLCLECYAVRCRCEQEMEKRHRHERGAAARATPSARNLTARNPQDADWEKGVIGCMRKEFERRPPRQSASSSSQADVEWANVSVSPPIWAIGLSYLTVSRHGDILLRSFAYKETPGAGPADVGGHGKRHWQAVALTMLGVMTLGFPLLAGIVLRLQELRWLKATQPRGR